MSGCVSWWPMKVYLPWLAGSGTDETYEKQRGNKILHKMWPSWAKKHAWRKRGLPSAFYQQAWHTKPSSRSRGSADRDVGASDEGELDQSDDNCFEGFDDEHAFGAGAEDDDPNVADPPCCQRGLRRR